MTMKAPPVPFSARYRPALYDHGGARKYLNADERQRFCIAISKVRKHDPYLSTLCETLFYTGCRISEALALTLNNIHQHDDLIAIRSLKKREKLLVRHVPVPTALIEAIVQTHRPDETSSEKRLWSYHRVTAYHHIKALMAEAEIVGPQACPKGLRHSFGMHAISNGVPLHLVQRWLGHADIATTAIYLNAVGKEEREMAARMW